MEGEEQGHYEYVELVDEEQQQQYQIPMQSTYGYAVDPRYYTQEGMMHPSYPYMYYNTYRYQYPVQHMEGVPLPPGIPGFGASIDPLEAVLGLFPCARLQNLPYDALIEDILALFQGLIVIDVVLVGQGEAYVIFANPMDFQMALQRHRQPIGRRIIDVSPASRADYYEAIATQHLREQDRRPQLRSGTSVADEGTGDEVALPSVSDADVVSLWGQVPPPPSSGPPTLQALGTSAYVGGELIATTRGASVASLSSSNRGGGGPGRGGLHASLQKRTGGGIQVGDHTGFLRMRGLPFNASKEDILRFFEGYNALPESVVLTYRNDGRATGEAYVGFSSPEDSKRAMELHRRTLGARYIELFISNNDEQGRALARFGNR